MQPTFFDSKASVVKNGLVQIVEAGDRVCIAASAFSMYTYQELKSQYESLGEFRFVFTSQAFARQRAPKEKREFYITQLSREQGPCGTEFEIKLRNELTQKPIALECAAWIRDKKRFKSFEGEGGMSGLLNVGKGDGDVAYCPSTSLPTCV